VLPSWRDRVCFALTPDALSWVRVARGFRPAVVEKNTVSCVAEANGAPWQGALQKLQGVLATQAPADAMVVFGDTMVLRQASRVVALAAEHRLPAMYLFGQFTNVGGLISYGPDLADLFRRAADYVDKILKGAKPSDLPVEQPIKYQLAINMKTAKALGLTVPVSLLARADEVIE